MGKEDGAQSGPANGGHVGQGDGFSESNDAFAGVVGLGQGASIVEQGPGPIDRRVGQRGAGDLEVSPDEILGLGLDLGVPPMQDPQLHAEGGVRHAVRLPQPDLFVDGPVPVARGPAEDPGRPKHGVGGQAVALDGLDRQEIAVEVMFVLEAVAERRGLAVQGLIGVEPQDPFRCAVIQRRISGPREIVIPISLDNRGAQGAGHGHRSVGRAGVVDDDVVDEGAG